MNDNLHKKYFISLEKLLMINQSRLGPNNNGQAEEEGYFCSELVAKTYKDLGYLTKDPQNPNYKASNNFYPYHFSEKFQINF